jgi:hypothetical protein
MRNTAGFGSIVGVGSASCPPAEGSFIRAFCVPTGGDLVAIRAEGVVQQVTRDSVRPVYRFEVIMRALDPLPPDVEHWSIESWQYAGPSRSELPRV